MRMEEPEQTTLHTYEEPAEDLEAKEMSFKQRPSKGSEDDSLHEQLQTEPGDHT